MRTPGLRQNVLDELVFEPSVDAEHVGVTEDDGTVTLTGFVKSYPEKLAAVQAARRVRCVRAIADEIEVRHPSDKKTADDEIAKRVIAILSWDATIPKDKIQAVVREGWITLTGSVDWDYQRRAAEADVRKLSGVRGVFNRIAIRPQPTRSGVEFEIAEALKRQAEVGADRIKVRIGREGLVTLEGEVTTLAERTLVEDAAWKARGVEAVDNRVVVGAAS